MNDLAQIIGLSPDGDWEDELELAERCHTDSCPHQMGEGCHHKPDCPHYCEDGHFSGDDMVMAEIGTGWPARWETLREHVETLTDDIAYIDLALDIDDAEWDQIRSHVKAALEALRL